MKFPQCECGCGKRFNGYMSECQKFYATLDCMEAEKMKYTFKQLNEISNDIGKVRAIINERDVLKETLKENYKPTLQSFLLWLAKSGYVPENTPIGETVQEFLKWKG